MFFVPDNNIIKTRLQGAKEKYLLKLGFTDAEKILVFYDNTVFSSGKKGTVITDKGIYSSGAFLTSSSFYIHSSDLKTIMQKNTDIFFNDCAADFCLLKKDEYEILLSILKYHFGI